MPWVNLISYNWRHPFAACNPGHKETCWPLRYLLFVIKVEFVLIIHHNSKVYSCRLWFMWILSSHITGEFENLMRYLWVYIVATSVLVSSSTVSSNSWSSCSWLESSTIESVLPFFAPSSDHSKTSITFIKNSWFSRQVVPKSWASKCNIKPNL